MKHKKKLKLQSETINNTYSWEARSMEWKNFFNKARGIKKFKFFSFSPSYILKLSTDIFISFINSFNQIFFHMFG